MFRLLAEHRQRLFPPVMFEDVFPSGRGRPSIPPDVVAAVIVLQTLYGLSDREAADAVPFDLRWKAACGVAVDAGSFHPSTLTYWRRRLAASGGPHRILGQARVAEQMAKGAEVAQGEALTAKASSSPAEARRPSSANSITGLRSTRGPQLWAALARDVRHGTVHHGQLQFHRRRAAPGRRDRGFLPAVGRGAGPYGLPARLDLEGVVTACGCCAPPRWSS